MDTSSPWGQESAESTAASPRGQQSVQAAAVVEQQVFFHFLLGSYSAAWSFLYPVFAAPGGNRLGRFWSIFWRRGGNGGQDGADGEHSKDIKEAGVEVEQSNRGDGGALHF